MADIKLINVTTVADTQYYYLKGQNTFLKERGFEIHCIASPGDYLTRLAERDGVAIHAVKISREINIFADILSLIRLRRLFRKIKPHIVNVSTPKAALLGSIAAWLAGVPIRVFLVRGLITETSRGLRRRIFRFLERVTSRLCTHRICVSRSLLHFARKEKLISDGDGEVVCSGMSNGVDAAKRFNPHKPGLEADSAAIRKRFGISPLSQGGLVLGYVGRLAFDKGVVELEAAWKKLSASFPSLHLLILGKWESVNPVIRKAQNRLKDDLRVHFAGFVEDPVPYYAAMDVLAFPTHGSEGFPNVLMESASMRIPVVASRVVGCVDAVMDNETGTLVQPQNAVALTGAVSTYLLDPDLRHRHGCAARERTLKDYMPEAIWEGYCSIYSRLLKDGGILKPAGDFSNTED